MLSAILIATVFAGSASGGCGVAWAAGACQLVAKESDPSVKILHCGGELTVHVASGARYRLLYDKGQQPPRGIRLDDGALLIEFHAVEKQKDFQILTPLAIAAVRGTKWAVEVTSKRTSVLSLEGAVGVRTRRVGEDQYVTLTDGEGADISEGDTFVIKKPWGQARVKALLARFGE
jgi:ferric-dicitrate binding protein FerR (iron transport regulator)